MDIVQLSGKEKAALLSEAHSYEFRLAPNDGELFLCSSCGRFYPVRYSGKIHWPGCVEAVLQEEGAADRNPFRGGTFGFISSREPERFCMMVREEMLEKETITGSEACLYHAQPGNCGPDKNIIWRKFSLKGK